ncbi:phosphoserine phosphatase SerB [soil metagenome]
MRSAHSVLFENVDASPATRDAVAAIVRDHALDLAWLEGAGRLSDFGLLVFDMDSTLVTIETIDEIADHCGRKAEVAAITEAAMRGEIADYTESLRRRVALLKGVSTAALLEVWQRRMHLSPGAERLVGAARHAGLRTLLVSGGFTFFTSRLAERLGLDFAESNTLGFAGDQLDGQVIGPVVDGAGKARIVLETCARLGFGPERAIVMGDGANDLPMMAVAGFSVAYRAKPAVRERASCAFDHCGLDGLLDLFPV